MRSECLVSCKQAEEPGLGGVSKELVTIDVGPHTGYMPGSLERSECLLYFVFR